MLHLEVVGMSPRTSVPVRIGYADRASSVTPTQRHTPLLFPRRGLSRLTQDHPADIEIVEEKQTSLPPEFSSKLVEAIRGSYQHTPPSSNRSSPTITEEIPSSSPSIVQGDIWGGGNTTERSSVDSQYSWDEFDRQAAKTVQNLFDEIDSVLFERRPNQAEYIYNECQEWGAQFPHLRILGRQLLPVQEAGFQMIERDMSRPNTMSSMGLLDITDQDFSGSSQDSQGLSLSGRKLKAILPPVEARSRNSGTPSSHSTEFSHLEEEVFESEGEYEEIIAVDYKDIFEDLSDGKKVITPRRRQPGYPPITPNACLKDGVASSAFDCMWQEVISWIRPLLRKYSNIVLGNKNFIQSLQNISLPPRNESTPGLPSRENSNIRYGLLRSNTVIDRPTDSKNLEEVLQIKRKIPIQREPSQILSDMPETSMPQARPASSNLPITLKRPNSTRYNRNVPPKGKLLLAPIPGYDRSVVKTPSVDEVPHPATMALLGKKLSVHPERRLSPPPHVIRNGALPPIGTPVELDTNPRFQTKKTSSRASSAVDKDLRAFKERLYNSQDARPSTTHAFRSETPQGRRASTPSSSAFNNLSMSRNNSFGIGGVGLDVRGNSLQPTHDQLGNIPQEILEDHESLDEHIHPNQWTPSTPSHGNPYYRAGRSRQISSLVRS